MHLHRHRRHQHCPGKPRGAARAGSPDEQSDWRSLTSTSFRGRADTRSVSTLGGPVEPETPTPGDEWGSPANQLVVDKSAVDEPAAYLRAHWRADEQPDLDMRSLTSASFRASFRGRANARSVSTSGGPDAPTPGDEWGSPVDQLAVDEPAAYALSHWSADEQPDLDLRSLTSTTYCERADARSVSARSVSTSSGPVEPGSPADQFDARDAEAARAGAFARLHGVDASAARAWSSDEQSDLGSLASTSFRGGADARSVSTLGGPVEPEAPYLAADLMRRFPHLVPSLSSPPDPDEASTLSPSVRSHITKACERELRQWRVEERANRLRKRARRLPPALDQQQVAGEAALSFDPRDDQMAEGDSPFVLDQRGNPKAHGHLPDGGPPKSSSGVGVIV